jgi:hypothetical protein
MVISVLVSSVVYHGFEPRSGQTKDYKIGTNTKSFILSRVYINNKH